MYLGGGELRFKFYVIRVRQNSSNLHIRKLKGVDCRAQIPSMGHHTWPYVTSLSLQL